MNRDNGKMRVLVVDEEIPYPLNSGKRLRTFNLLKPLAVRHELTFVCRQHEHLADTMPHALEEAGIRTVMVPHPIRKKQGAGFYLLLLANLFSRYPYSVSSHISRPLAATIEHLLTNQFDLIHCEWTPYAINLRQWLGAMPTIVDAHNVEATVWKRHFQVEQHPLKKAFIYSQWKKMATFEHRFLPKFSRCVAVSTQDAEQIARSVAKERIDVVANGVDVSFFTRTTPLVRGKSSNQHLVFTGSLDWRPNVDGLLFFLDNVYPLLQSRYPRCRLTIVGRNPMPVLRNRVAGKEGVVLTGTVDDVRPFMEEAAVYIVPLRVGGGSRLKILEALAMQMPVVSTTIGAEGLDVTPDKDILLADAPEAFAAAVASVLEDPRKAVQLGVQGRHLVEQSYQWHVLADRLEQSWRQAVATWQSP